MTNGIKSLLRIVKIIYKNAVFKKKIGSYISYVKEIIRKFNLQSEDVFKKMNLSQNSPPLDLHTLIEKFKYFNSLLTQPKIEKLCKELLRGKDQIEIKELNEILFPASSKSEY